MRSSLLVLCSALFLSACGGSNDPLLGDKPDDVLGVTSLKGKVIDGYVQGATVWLDFNGNEQYDEGEPKAISGDAGNYLLELTPTQMACAAYTTTYVDVPVGAIDEDLGEVTEAYQMVRPPQLSTITDDTLLHISPLTTVLWQQVKKELGNTQIESCSALVNDQAKRQALAEKIQSRIDNVVAHYNISASEIFEDFIASGNAANTALAQSIVKGLQRSYDYTATLEATYPEATEIRVVHYLGTHTYYHDDSDNHWFREVVVFMPDHFVARDDMLDDTLTEVTQPIYYRDTLDLPWQGGTLSRRRDVIYRGKNAGLECNNSETMVFTQGGVTYGLSNRSGDSPYVSTVAECDFGPLATTDVRRSFTFDYQSGENVYYLTDIRQDDLLILPNWWNVHQSPADFAPNAMVEAMQHFGHLFEDPVLVPFTSFYKRQTTYQGDDRIQIQFDHTGQWTRTHTFADGTYEVTCSTDGSTWQACG